MKKAVFVILVVAAIAAGARGGTPQCAGGGCAADAAEPVFAVHAPVPESAVKRMQPAPRLKSLDGKTIALAGGSFMANVTHPELKRLILAEYPTAKVYLLSEIGSAGPYPRPGVRRREKEEFQRRLKEFKIDAVVSGNGGCGLCTPKEAGSCIAAEALDIPSVMIAAPGFADQARSAARSAGLDEFRVAVYPGAFAAHTREQLVENTRKVLWPQIKAALAGAGGLDRSGRAKRGCAQDVVTGTFAEIQQIFLDSGWTDGLPVIPPTASAVAEFLKFTDLPPDAPLGPIPPAQRNATVRHVAVNGVMAGCPPEFMPILLAFAEAMKNGDFRRTLASTHGWTPYCWLNGPIVRQLGFDCGQGAISNPKNAVLGRFINLAMINLGGYKIKENRMGTFGYLMPWCLAEDDAAAASAGWKPWHVQRGFKASDSTLTACSAINWGNNLSPASTDAERIKDMIALDAVEKSQMAAASGMPCTYRVFLLTEGTARNLARKYRDKESLERAVRDAARIPLRSRAYANYWGNPGSAFDPAKYTLGRHARKIARSEGAERTPPPPWLEWIGTGDIYTVPAMAAGKSAFIVTGDPARNKEMCLPGGGFATVKIKLPADWEKLLAGRKGKSGN